MRIYLSTVVLATLAALTAPQKAKAYDVDCAIMLCMAGGFPPSAVCAHAYKTMIQRITPIPVRPPFGICTFANVPVSAGGPGGTGTLDISLPEYAWLGKTRVIWWRLAREGEIEGGHWYDWSVRSCMSDTQTCVVLEDVRESDVVPSGSFETENALSVVRPSIDGNQRAVMIEYADQNGAMARSDWFFY